MLLNPSSSNPAAVSEIAASLRTDWLRYYPYKIANNFEVWQSSDKTGRLSGHGRTLKIIDFKLINEQLGKIHIKIIFFISWLINLYVIQESKDGEMQQYFDNSLHHQKKLGKKQLN